MTTLTTWKVLRSMSGRGIAAVVGKAIGGGKGGKRPLKNLEV